MNRAPGNALTRPGRLIAAAFAAAVIAGTLLLSLPVVHSGCSQTPLPACVDACEADSTVTGYSVEQTVPAVHALLGGKNVAVQWPSSVRSDWESALVGA